MHSDARSRKVRELREKPSGDPSRLTKKENKLALTRRALETQTEGLYFRFGELDAGRFAVVTPAVNAFVNAERAFFREGSAALAGVQPIPPSTAAGGAAVSGGGQRGSAGMSGTGAASRQEQGHPEGQGSYYTSPPPLPVVAKSQYPAPSGGYGSLSESYGASPSTRPSSLPGGGDHGGESGVRKVVTSADASARPAVPSSGNPFGASQAGAMGTAAGATTTIAGGRSASSPPLGGDRVRASFAYTAASPDELSLAAGEVVQVTQRHDDGWAHGVASDGRRGAFPLNFTTPA